MKTTVIRNPKSGGLAGSGTWEGMKKGLEEAIGPFEVAFTEQSGDATRLSRQALRKGSERILAIGGDGTLGEVVNGFFDKGAPVNSEAVFSFIMSGTGNDFQKTFRRKNDLQDALDSLKNPREKRIDLGRVSYIANDGSPADRIFLNIASFGMSGAVDQRVNRMSYSGVLGGKAAFLIGTLGALMSYRNKPVRFTVDKGEAVEALVRLVIVANGKYAGGGMLFAPEAEVDDGLFDIVSFEDFTLPRLLRHMSKIYQGRHIGQKGIRHLSGRRVEVTSDEEVLLDVDGEAPGRLPATFELLPGALRLQY